LSTHVYCKLNSRKSKDRILVPSDDNSRNIGDIKDDIFTKFNFQSSKHICHKHNAIGLDIGAFKNYILPNATEIVCPDKEKSIAYSLSVPTFMQNAFKDDLGWGIQMFCPLKIWNKTQTRQWQRSLWEL